MAIKWDRDPEEVKVMMANAYGVRDTKSGLPGLSDTSQAIPTVLTLTPHRKLELQETRNSIQALMQQLADNLDKQAASRLNALKDDIQNESRNVNNDIAKLISATTMR